MNKLAAFALALIVATRQMPLRNAAAGLLRFPLL